MDSKAAEKAIAWTRGVVNRNNAKLPDWGSYKELVRTHLKDSYNIPFKIPLEYQYAYLRVKGLDHSDAMERMGLELPRAAPVVEEKKSWWKFW